MSLRRDSWQIGTYVVTRLLDTQAICTTSCCMCVWSFQNDFRRTLQWMSTYPNNFHNFPLTGSCSVPWSNDGRVTLKSVISALCTLKFDWYMQIRHILEILIFLKNVTSDFVAWPSHEYGIWSRRGQSSRRRYQVEVVIHCNFYLSRSRSSDLRIIIKVSILE